MNEPIDCAVCTHPGKLRWDYYPPVVEYERRHHRSKFCQLPPRDTKGKVERPTWLQYQQQRVAS